MSTVWRLNLAWWYWRCGGREEYLNCGQKCRTLASLRDLHLFFAQHIDPVIPHGENVAYLPICSRSIVMEYLCSYTTVVYAVNVILLK